MIQSTVLHHHLNSFSMVCHSPYLQITVTPMDVLYAITQITFHITGVITVYYSRFPYHFIANVLTNHKLCHVVINAYTHTWNKSIEEINRKFHFPHIVKRHELWEKSQCLISFHYNFDFNLINVVPQYYTVYGFISFFTAPAPQYHVRILCYNFLYIL